MLSSLKEGIPAQEALNDVKVTLHAASNKKSKKLYFYGFI